MAYCTTQDLLQYMSESQMRKYFPNPDMSEEEFEAAMLDTIGQASEEIDSYLKERYVLPFAQVPDVLRTFCIRISLYAIVSRKGVSDQSMSASMRQQYEDTITRLKDIEAYTAGLGIEQTDGTSTPYASVSYDFPKSPLKGG